MKLSFSTNGWQGISWSEFVALAKDAGFDGIELHDPADSVFRGPDGPLAGRTNNAAVRQLFREGLQIPCVDSVSDLADAASMERNVDEIVACIGAAAGLRAPFVRLHAVNGGGHTPEETDDAVAACIARVLLAAEQRGVVLLLESCGVYADTLRLRDVLNRFACDWLGALWDVHHPYRYHQEDPETTISNLGAYIRHVHMKDSVLDADGTVRYCLIGEGTLPLNEMMDALSSLGYEGFVSLETDPNWVEGLGVPELIFPHFVHCMSRYGRAYRTDRLYRSRSGEGRYIWKKETLIDLTLSEVLDAQVREFPDQIALRYTTLDYTRTYAQFRDDVDAFARSLIALGVKPGDKVAVWATNVPQWYIAFWAVTKIGSVLVSMNTAYKIRECEYLLRQSDTHTLILTAGYRDSDYAAIVAELCPELAQEGKTAHHCRRLPFLRNVITVGFEMDGCLTWDEALRRGASVPIEEVRRRAAETDIHDVCNMQYTSGTTGFPKGVMLTHHNVANNGKCIGDRMDLSTADRMMIQVPMFHCFGMVLAMTAAVTHGTSMMPLPYFSTKPALSCITSERITCFHGVPTMFIAMLEHPDFAKTDFSHMRTGIMAGSTCPESTMRDVVEKMNMREITIVYGQTEASPGCTMSCADDPLEVRVSTVGRPLPEIECRIIDPATGLELPDGETGEFVARGYNIMKGYYKMPKATRAAIDADGWLHTGDLACRTPEGNFRITGRLKDMIIRGGENIYPKEIEEFILTHPKVSDVQVVGIPDEQLGEEIAACVIPKAGEPLTVDEIRAYVRSNMARHKVPRYVLFYEQFPMNAAGKILKYKLRDEAAERAAEQNAAK